ncbi:DUF1189 domain-containing protein [Jeotgalibacillus haloalkalitolerans]|uniref:DUF1189 domain-containing protein n=1 Tax=Jeotgalibacillus haloalkalitolerans TaxID=3104292 RepID=A0ABU5KLP0_9BACL|nr:DUF1189 domain-containing protein [Jeotgalibacillus sp. HH7-29]MDZ5712178.1 DUF1189 domain-containing protein [Jeotgalibacillus sp. HH7-29]
MNIFKQLYKSLYSPKDIARFRFQGIGKTILFVFLLGFLSIIPAIIQVSTIGEGLFSDGEELLLNDLPSFEVQNGELQTEEAATAEASSSGITFYVDGSDQMTSGDLTDEEAAVAFLSDRLAVATAGSVQEYQYDTFEGFDLSSAGIASLLNSLEGAKFIIYFFILAFIFILVAGILFIKATVFGWIGTKLAASAGRKLTYRHSFRMAAYSSALPAVFFLIADLVGSVIPLATLINWFVTGLILYLAIKEIPQPKKKSQA